ncbi:mitotic-spindle organizing protein 1A-like [Wolffia australiana]
MDRQGEAARNAKESLDLVLQISNILDTGLDRHTLSILIALCERGVNPESLAALIREFSPNRSSSAASSTSVHRDSFVRRSQS